MPDIIYEKRPTVDYYYKDIVADSAWRRNIVLDVPRLRLSDHTACRVLRNELDMDAIVITIRHNSTNVSGMALAADA